MQINALRLITRAMRLTGAVDGEELPTPAESQDGLETLNEMLDAWSIDNLAVPVTAIEDFPLTSGQQDYTLGPGGNFDTIRPPDVTQVKASLMWPSNPSQPLEIPMAVISVQQWQDVPVKAVDSSIAQRVYIDRDFPLRKCRFFPIPNATSSVRFYLPKPLVSFANLTTLYDMPPGYIWAIRYNLAVKLWPDYGPPQLNPNVDREATKALADIRRINMETPVLTAPLGTVGAPQGSGGTYNWLTDEGA